MSDELGHDESIRGMLADLLDWLQRYPEVFLFSEFINAAQSLDDAGQADKDTTYSTLWQAVRGRP
ncbi:MAG: hypothetical protein ABJO09_11560 [Hyphomicrobiales bacterium]